MSRMGASTPDWFGWDHANTRAITTNFKQCETKRIFLCAEHAAYGGLSRCPREPHMMYSSLAAGHLRRARGGAQWQEHDL